MAFQEHEIIIGEDITVRIVRDTQDKSFFNVHSDSEKFEDVFGVNAFQIEEDGENVREFIRTKVEPYNRSEATKLLDAILRGV